VMSRLAKFLVGFAISLVLFTLVCEEYSLLTHMARESREVLIFHKSIIVALSGFWVITMVALSLIPKNSEEVSNDQRTDG
jgi:hypothetical protein